MERRKDGGEKGEGKQRISGWLHTLLGAGGSSLLAGLRPVLHFQFGLFESINLPPVWAPIKEAALQSLHSAVASCRLSFLFTTDFLCLSPLPPILGTLWTETQYPPSPEQGLAPDLEFQEISRVVSGQQPQTSPPAAPSPVQNAPPTLPSCEAETPITDWHGASPSEPLFLLLEGQLCIHIAYPSCKEAPRYQGILFSPVQMKPNSPPSVCCSPQPRAAVPHCSVPHHLHTNQLHTPAEPDP